jgi:hypothetical protein
VAKNYLTEDELQVLNRSAWTRSLKKRRRS